MSTAKGFYGRAQNTGFGMFGFLGSLNVYNESVQTETRTKIIHTSVYIRHDLQSSAKQSQPYKETTAFKHCLVHPLKSSKIWRMGGGNEPRPKYSHEKISRMRVMMHCYGNHVENDSSVHHLETQAGEWVY